MKCGNCGYPYAKISEWNGKKIVFNHWECPCGGVKYDDDVKKS